MRNDEDLVPLDDSEQGEIRLYVQVQAPDNADVRTADLRELIAETDRSTQLVDTPDETTTPPLVGVARCE